LPGQSGGKWRQYLGPELSAYCRHQSAEIRGELLRCLRAKDAAASGIGAVQPEGRGLSLIIDTRGYGAIHNQKYSRPLTGNYEADLVGNRTRRIWDDVTGQRGAKNTCRYWSRPTPGIPGKSSPKSTCRSWSAAASGAVRVGCDSSVLLEG
jgi:hypothetical protein